MIYSYLNTKLELLRYFKTLHTPLGYATILFMRYLVFLFLLIVSTAEARPVSYPDGWTLMSRNNWEKSRLHFHYSPTVNYSLGTVFEDYRGSSRKNFSLQLNNLLFRRNTSASQSNAYSMLELGIANNGSSAFNKALRLSGDWETRRYFTSYSASFRHAGSLDYGSFHQKARIGLAPYLAEFGSIHTWLMFQVEHHPEEDKELRVAPILRVFKNEFLIELGLDSEKDFIFNFIYRH